MDNQSPDEDMLLNDSSSDLTEESLSLFTERNWITTKEHDVLSSVSSSTLLPCDIANQLHCTISGALDHIPLPQAPETTQAPTFNRSGVRGDQGEVLAQIEAIFETMADALLAEASELCITLDAHRTRTPIREDDRASFSMGRGRGCGRGRNTTVRFPGKSAEEAWRFTVIVRLLEMIHECKTGNTILTKRDLYYRDPALFGKQLVVDRYIDYIALAFGVTRSFLNVTAAAKGLMAGRAVLHRRDGSSIDLTSNNEGFLIPDLVEVLSVDLSAAQWVVVIEKEATFQSVLTSEDWTSMQWQGIVVTGKGYPDIASRAMVRFLSQPSPQNGFAGPPVYGLMDYDPDGIAILSTYMRGSSKLGHESESLVVPDMRWIGLRSRHIVDNDLTHQVQGLMPLTRRDRHKARRMLEQKWVFENGEVAEWRSELQVMLVLNLKAELQVLDTVPEGLTRMIRYGMSQV